MTKKTLFINIFFFLMFKATGQYVLDTPDGKKVKLNSNGTWTYVKSGGLGNSNSTIPKLSTSKYVSSSHKYVIWFDPTQWFYDTTKTSNTLSWDATFYSKDYAITGFCLDSRLSMPLEDLESAVKPMWEEVGKISSFVSFKDTINNLGITGFDMLLEVGEVTYQYRGYIYSSTKGSFQLIVGTQKEIFEEDKNKIEQFLKGFAKL